MPTLRHYDANSIQRESAAVAAAAQRAATPANEQEHAPHVSVLLQEVLHNLNHMPIKVRDM